MTLVFIMVGKNDRPIFEVELSDKKKTEGGGVDSSMAQFIIHSALDVVDEQQWKKPEYFLKQIDQYKGLAISSYVTPSNVRLMLLHSPSKGDDSIKAFFAEVHDLYIKIAMNPFYQPNTPITSTVFAERVKGLLARKLM